MTLALTLTAQEPQGASNRQDPATESRRVESSEEGGSSEAPPVSVFFGISDEGAEQADKWNSESDTDLCRPDRHRIRHTRLAHNESQSERHVKETKSKCKRIARLLTDAPNPQNKGALLFKKRRQRVKKYTLVSYGTGDNKLDSEDQIEEETEEVQSAEYNFVATSDSELEEQYSLYRQQQNLTLNWRSVREMEALPDTKGKGVLMFAQRRKRIDEIVSEHEEMRSKGSAPASVGPERADVHNIYDSKEMYPQADEANYLDINLKQYLDYQEEIQQLNDLSSVQKPLVPNRTAKPFLGFQKRTSAPAMAASDVPATRKHDARFKVPVPITTNPQVWSPTGDIIASRDERISVPAIKTGILPESKRKTSSKQASMLVKGSELHLQNKGERRSFIEPEEDCFSLGAEACNFMQPRTVKLKNPPPVAPKPVINPLCPPWMRRSPSCEPYIPPRSPVSLPCQSPTRPHSSHYLQQEEWAQPQQMAGRWAADQTAAALQTPANTWAPVHTTSQLHLQPSTNSWNQQQPRTELEFSQEEYRQLQVEFWSRFYSCCLQYQEVQCTPLSVTVSSHTGMVCLLRKGFVSFLLPCFAVDHLCLSYDQDLSSEDDTPITEEPDLARDVLQLVRCVRLVGDAVSPEGAYEMQKALEYLQPPEGAAELVLESMLCDDSENVIGDVQNRLQNVKNPTAAMMVLLRELDLETDSEPVREGPLAPGENLGVRLSLSQLYSSSAAVSLVSQAVCHTALSRARFLRDLLILQRIYLRFGDNVFLGGGAQLLQLQQDLIPRTSNLLSSYHLLKHVSQSLASPVTVDTIDANLQHLTVLELSDSSNLCSTSRAALCPQTVVELFYQTCARRTIISQIFSQQPRSSLLLWNQGVSSVVHLLAQLLWPANPGFQFPECLMANCQYTELQEYVRLIGPWCQVNIGSCRFMLAQCYLANGEGQKALQCFQEAASEVEKEEFLMRLTGGEAEEPAATPRLQYYNKVLRLLEDVGLPELVIQMAALAITEATSDVSSQAALWTRIFKHHLDLGHNSEAYEALTQNPDSSMQLDCLRQLVVVLCERSQLQDLVQFPYVNLHDEVVSIIESRARGLDLLTHNYYELLYAFHIIRHNYRKAGAVMCELGFRVGRELRSLVGLQKQVNCFLTALTCLRLITPEYAWIVQPAAGTTYERAGASPKRNAEGEFTAEPVKRQVDVLELEDLQKEYFLSRCRLTLAQHHPPSAAIAGGASAAELLSLLVQTGLFDSALTLSQTFGLSLTPVFEGLTFKCIQLQFGGEESQSEAWTWLAANQLTMVNTKESSAADEAWRLLASYLSRFPSTSGQHHRYVIHKLLSHGVPLPDWLVASYKRVDAPSLLRLMLNFDLLEAAAELVLEYIDAVLGRGHQYFGIERPLSATSPPAWLPYMSIDQLLQALGETQTHNTLYGRVADKLSEYHGVVEQMSKNRLNLQACVH